MLNAFFAEKLRGGQSFYTWVEEEMQDHLSTELPFHDKTLGLDLPDKWVLSQINQTRITNLPSKRMYAEIRNMKLGSVGFFSGDLKPHTDLNVVLQTIKRMLESSGPPRRTGTYNRSHEIWVNGRRGSLMTGSQKETDYGQVMSRLDYASTLETADYKFGTYRTYQRVMGVIFNSGLWQDEYDITMTFANPIHFGGNILTSRYKKANPVYAIPVITVAPLNSLPRRFKSSFVYKKRRSLGQRQNVKALLKKRDHAVLTARLSRLR